MERASILALCCFLTFTGEEYGLALMQMREFLRQQWLLPSE